MQESDMFVSSLRLLDQEKGNLGLRALQKLVPSDEQCVRLKYFSVSY